MKFFSRTETLGVALILLVTFAFAFKGIKTSERRARDAQRRADIGAISDALNRYFEDFGFFPPSEDGKIKMCKGENFEKIMGELKTKEVFDAGLFFEALKGCNWGSDSFRDVLDESYEPYLQTLPADPWQDKGVSYLYLSNTKRFQIYSYLEGERDEDQYNESIVKRGLACGVKICSLGKSSGTTPLDISIEEYERQLESQKTGNP